MNTWSETQVAPGLDVSADNDEEIQDRIFSARSNGFDTDIDVPLRQKIYNISNVESGEIVRPDGLLHDRNWKTMSFVDVFVWTDCWKHD